MSANKQRPVNLKLQSIHFPITAIVSILHRISGVVLSIVTPVYLYALFVSTQSAADYRLVQTLFQNPIIGVVTWLCMTALIYHTIAGLRHLAMDFLGIGETLQGGKIGAWLTIIITLVLSVFSLFYLELITIL